MQIALKNLFSIALELFYPFSFFRKLQFMELDHVYIQLSLQGYCWALWSLVVFDLDYDPIRNNVVMVFNGKFFEPQSIEQRLNFLPVFVAHYESCSQDIKTVILEIKVLMSFQREKTILSHSIFFSLRIVKSL